MPLKAAAEAAREEATAVAEAVKEEVMVAVKEEVTAATVVETEEVLAEDAKVLMLVADSEISLVNHVKVEILEAVEDAKAVEAAKEDADHRKHYIKWPGQPRAIFVYYQFSVLITCCFVISPGVCTSFQLAIWSDQYGINSSHCSTLV